MNSNRSGSSSLLPIDRKKTEKEKKKKKSASDLDKVGGGEGAAARGAATASSWQRLQYLPPHTHHPPLSPPATSPAGTVARSSRSTSLFWRAMATLAAGRAASAARPGAGVRRSQHVRRVAAAAGGAGEGVVHERTVYIEDTDCFGVVFYANCASVCTCGYGRPCHGSVPRARAHALANCPRPADVYAPMHARTRSSRPRRRFPLRRRRALGGGHGRLWGRSHRQREVHTSG